MAIVQVPDRARFGGVRVDAAGLVEGFLEKGQQGAGDINAGLYRLHRRALPATPSQAYSLEADVMPGLVARRAVSAQRIDGGFIDIGVPEDYRRFCERHGG